MAAAPFFGPVVVAGAVEELVATGEVLTAEVVLAGRFLKFIFDMPP